MPAGWSATGASRASRGTARSGAGQVAFVMLAVVALAAIAPPTANAQARAGQGADAGSPIEFWARLGDTTLTRLIGEALVANPDVRGAGARVDGARAARTRAALDLAPVVTASSGYSVQQLSSVAVPGAGGSLPDQRMWDAGVHLSWELDVFGRGRRTLQGRNALIGAAEEGVLDTELLLAADVARAYYDLRGYQERLAVAVRNAENQRRTLELTLDRLEAGRGTALDTDRARAQLSTTLAAIPALESAIAASRHRLATLLGREPGTAASLAAGEAQLPSPPELAPVANPATMLQQRADVRAAERVLDAHSALVSAARANYLPRLSIGGTAGYTARAFDALGASGTPRYTVGPVLSWPLFDLGRVKASVDQARAAETEAEARYRLAILTAHEEIETSLVAYENARERLRHLEDAAEASERATELARLRFEEGGSGFLEVLDAERSLLEAQDRLAAGRAEAHAAIVAVYRAFGGRWPE